MPTAQVSARIDRTIKDALLEELEDVEDPKRVRHGPTRPLDDVLAEPARDGQG